MVILCARSRKCRFVECEEVFDMDKLNAHEKICQHRIVKCPFSKCEAEIALSKLLDHLGKKTCCFNSKQIIFDTSSKSGKVICFISKESVLGNKDVG